MWSFLSDPGGTIWAALEPLLMVISAALTLAAFVYGVWRTFVPPRVLAILVFAAAVLLGVGSGFLWGERSSRLASELADAKAALAARNRDVAIAMTAEADAATRAEAQAIYADTLEKQVNDYETEIASRTPATEADGGPCRLTDDDLRALERLR